MKFSAEQLLRAMAPIDIVIDAFLEEKVSQNCDNNVDVWSYRTQGNFATLIASSKDVGASVIENIQHSTILKSITENQPLVL